MFSNNLFLYLFFLFLLLCLLRFLYLRYSLHLQAARLRAAPVSRPAATLAPYFIRLTAEQDRRLAARRAQEERRAADLPPKYEDIAGAENTGATDDSGLPGYTEWVEQGRARTDQLVEQGRARPDRY